MQVSTEAQACPHCGAPILNSSRNNIPIPIWGIISVGSGVGALFMPYFASVFLVPIAFICGIIAIRNDQKGWGLSGIILGLIGLASIIYTSYQISQITNVLKDNTGNTSLPQSFGSSSIVTKSEYEKVSEGMSYSQVRAIIGCDGEEMSHSDYSGISTIMYSWKNSNGSNMIVMFQDDRLINKSEFGLP